jgi:hypothetical protein
MTRAATLTCLMVLATVPAEAREPVGAHGEPWTQHPVLSAPTPLLAVSDRDTTDGGTTAEFFTRLTELGFACLAFDPPRRRIRRTEVVCTRGEEKMFGYAGGWPKGGSVFIVDRIRVGRGGREGSAELLGGAQVGVHVRWVRGGAEPPELMAVWDAPRR